MFYLFPGVVSNDSRILQRISDHKTTKEIGKYGLYLYTSVLDKQIFRAKIVIIFLH